MNWNVNEILGNQYLYVSKAGNDALAAAFFGKAAHYNGNHRTLIYG